MIDFTQFQQEELTELKELILKNIEKSDIDKYYLFTQNSIEKAMIFVWCHRFLVNAYNLMEDGKLRVLIQKEVKENQKKHDDLVFFLDRYNKRVFNQHRFKEKIFRIVHEDNIVNTMIDNFAILSERANVLQLSKIKGFVLEGKSAQEYNKIFGHGAEPIRQTDMEKQIESESLIMSDDDEKN
jgi:hypothetical protein